MRPHYGDLDQDHQIKVMADLVLCQVRGTSLFLVHSAPPEDGAGAAVRDLVHKLRSFVVDSATQGGYVSMRDSVTRCVGDLDCHCL